MSDKKVKAPTLFELKTRPCSPEELQAALVQIIELHNKMHGAVNDMIGSGQIRSKMEVLMNTPYGL